ncbi:sortase A [Conyzicola nivalis]|uniref:Sortase A n=1 Tax=Conyzicola nivalis TaxID=1477021 RepID=A0ABV2QRW8_9MICO
MSELEPLREEAAPRRPRRAKLSLVGVLGELLVTAGVLVLLFLGWQVWLNDIIVGAEQTSAANELAEKWDDAPATSTPDVAATPDPTATAEAPAAPVDPGEPVIAARPATAESFANLIVPRLGADYRRPIAEGVGFNVLNNRKTGVGHYPQTQMPGEVGNFAIAAHRTTYGAPFHDINTLLVGDSIYVETEDGWYQYVYRGTEYVRPTGVGVLEPVPQVAGMAATDRVITLTSCHPYFSSAERVIAYGVFETWFPRAGGPPAEIATLVEAGGN